MDRIHDELDEVKLEAEKLREEFRAKTELYHSLKKAQAEQLSKSRQDKLEIEKLAQELNTKSEEICEIRQMYEELQSSLLRKDSFLQQISSANEKLRSEYSEKFSKLEGENRELVSSLDKASARILDLEEKTRTSSDEIAGLKRLLLIKREKSFEEVQKNASKDLKRRDEYILELEEANRIVEDQLKWKNEQFSHLEEAHGQIRAQFEVSKMEWQKEKSSLVDEIAMVRAALDAQVRVSENLEMELRLSHQALAREESRRKVLEIELSESRAKFKNVFLDCQVAKSEIEELTVKRDEEIAELRMLARKKETMANEMKYKTEQLEQENIDLLVSLKDIQEAQINSNSQSSSLKKLRNKIEGLERLHNKCAINLKEKEGEWDSQREKLIGQLNNCLSELGCRDKSIRQLQNELEDCHCLLEVKSEEISTLIAVLTSEFSVAHSKLYEAKENLNVGIMEIEEKNVLLNQQLQLQNDELQKVHAELKERCDEIAVLKERVESSDSLKQKNKHMENELRRYKAMLDESNESQRRLKQQLLDLELEYSEGENVKNALEMVNIELVNRNSEVEKTKFELQKSKFEVQFLKLNLEENQQALKLENASLFAMVKDKDDEIGKLQEQIHQQESVIIAKSDMLNQEKDNCIRLAEDRQSTIRSLENEIDQLKNELAEKEAANVVLLDAHKALEQETKILSSNIKEKDQKIQQLQKEFESLVVEKRVMLDEAFKTAEAQKNLQIEEKNQIIINLEDEVNSLRNEIEFREKSFIKSKQMVLQLEALEQTKTSEIQEMKNRLRDASTDREYVLAQLEGICGKIEIFCTEDVELVNVLGKMLISDEESEPARNMRSTDGLGDITFSPSWKSIQMSLDERTPLTELNC